MNQLSTKIKLSEAINLFLDKSLINNSAKSIGSYILVLTRFRISVGDDLILNIINNKKHFDDFFEKIKEQYKLNETTLFLTAMNLRVFLKYLKANGYIDNSIPIDELVNYEKYKNGYKKRFYSLSPESLYPFEEDQIRMHWFLKEPTIVSLRNAFLVNLMLDTGIKSKILRSLLKENFNYRKQILSITCRHRNNQVPLEEETSILGRNYLLARRDYSNLLLVNHSIRINKYCLINKTIERVIKQTINGVGFNRKITSTNFRYTFIAKNIANGLNTKEIQELAGYSDTFVPRFGVRSDSHNKAERNIMRHIDDYKKVLELKKEWELSRTAIEKILDSGEVDLKLIRSQKFAKESALINFVAKVRNQYLGFVRLQQRAKQWGINPDRLINFCIVNSDKGKKISRVWYIDEKVLLDDIPPLKTRGRKIGILKN